MELTHASFFSGAGGLDMGLERAGFRTVSFSEIDPYASAVLAERWPGVPNLGDITGPQFRVAAGQPGHSSDRSDGAAHGEPDLGDPWHHATLWTGGFPCQDLSVAGKRRGMGTHGERADTRSGLAYAFLDLVERYRPPAIVLENVPGLLSSNRGRDFYALQRRLAELGYVGAYRVLDAQFFGVPQRRRRVFIVALDARRGLGADSAAEVLSVGSRCLRHPPAGVEAGPGTAEGVTAGALLAREGKGVGHNFPDDHLIGALNDLGHHGWTANAQSVAQGHIVRSSPDSRGVRAPDGLAGRLDDRELAATLNSGGNDGGFRTEPGEHLVLPGGFAAADDELLPLGLDSHRYRCCGNGVVSTVPEWFGERLARLLA